MKRNKIIVSLVGASFAFLVAGCSGSSDESDIQNVTVDSTDLVTADTTLPVVDYSVPTPNELFEIIKLQGGKQQMNLVNSLENSENYVDVKSKALNFGVYSADVAYLSCFGIGIDFLKYFKKIEELGEELGISGAFDEGVMERIENNEANADSLFMISNDTYYNSYMYLEENQKGVELSLIMAGGYIESLYIITNLVKTYSDTDPIVEKSGDQKVVMENLIDFISQYGDDASVADVITDLKSLSEVFEKNMTFEESSSKVSNSEDGTLMISGGGAYIMTKDAF
ncbi:MAG: hypothetical protein IT222_03735, partial [Crocinitomix sp.]|nr:hypothetical protein [Crocinitomix sp.]